jgi:regulator of sirC expression with transglutaminase-like and TPR domain
MKVFGRYQVGAELARGSMGVVYRAVDQGGREVALKVMQGHLMSAEGLARFQREGEIAKRLRHPNLVAVFEMGVLEGRAYQVMELVEGEDLDRCIRSQGPFASQDAARLTRALAGALAHVHDAGVLHRDIKPANVILEPNGTPRLIDFGLAFAGEGDQRLTRSHAAVGTPAYMAPEQARGDKTLQGPATDVYGLGATLYTLLCGEQPFVGATAMALRQQVVGRPLQPPSQRAPNLVDPQLEAICLRSMAKDPQQRYPHGRALAEALDAYLAQEEPPPARRGAVAVAMAGLLVLGMGGGLAWLSQRRTARPAPSTAAAPAPTLDDAQRAERVEAALLEAEAARIAEAWSEAAAAYDEAARLDPQRADAWRGLGRAALNLGQVDDALVAFTHLAELRPFEGRVERARAWVSMSNATEALTDLDAAIAERPQAAEPRRLRAQVYLRRRDYRRAGRDVEAIVERTSEDRNLHARLEALVWEELLADVDALLKEPRPGEWKGALLVSRVQHPFLDEARVEKDLGRLVERARPQVDAAGPAASARVDALITALFSSNVLRGNRADYEDPHNSCVSCVIARGKGLPITLSLALIEVARRLGLELKGVAFPGQYLVRQPTDPPRFFDPFSKGAERELKDLRRLLDRMRGGALEAKHLESSSPLVTIARTINNMANHLRSSAGATEIQRRRARHILRVLMARAR